MKESVRIPHTLTLLMGLIVLIAAATWIVPSGEFRYQEGARRPTPVPGTYRVVEKTGVENGKVTDIRQGLKGVLTAPIKGTVAAADVVAFVLLLGGVFGVLGKTGAIEAGITKLVELLRGKGFLIIPVAMTAFGLGGTIFGMAEETIPFYLIIIPLVIALGYDSMTGAMIIYLGAQTGSTASTLNPFSVGIAQATAGVPIMSGTGFRWVQFAVSMTIAIAFVMWYASRVKRDPGSSPMAELDRENRELFLAQGSGDKAGFRPFQAVILLGFGAGIGLMAYGVKEFGWYIEEVSMVFVGIGIFAGLTAIVVGEMSEKEMAQSFIAGCRDLCFTALVIGLARGVLVVAEDGKIVDTVLYTASNALAGMPQYVFVTMSLFLQGAINFLVPSSSAQAALTMPLMAPLGDLVNVDRQIIVTAYQYGCGLGHFIFPTQGILVAALGVAGIPIQVWLRTILPFMVLLTCAAVGFLLIGLRLTA